MTFLKRAVAPTQTDCLGVGADLGRLMMEQAVAGQGQLVPCDSRECAEETVSLIGSA